MILTNKLAFEVWVGIVVLVAVVGGVAGVTLILDDDQAASLTRTQANSSAVSSTLGVPSSTPSVFPTAKPFVSQEEITGAALGIAGALSGGVAP